MMSKSMRGTTDVYSPDPHSTAAYRAEAAPQHAGRLTAVAVLLLAFLLVAWSMPAAAAAAWDDPVAQDYPIGYWLLDDSSANTAADSVPGPRIAHPGAYAGSGARSTTWPLGLLGAHTFAGGACDGVVLDPTAVQVPSELSVEGWVRTTGSSGVIFRWRWYGYLLRVQNGRGEFSVSTGSGSGFVAGVAVAGNKMLNDGNWHHVAGVRTSGATPKLQLYVDGELDSEVALSAAAPQTYYGLPKEAAIGRDGAACDGVVPSMNGTLAAVAVFDRALSAARVRAHARGAGLPGAGAELCKPIGPLAVTQDGWNYVATLSANEGVVVTDLRFGPRAVARKISVPYILPYNFGVSVKPIGHLTVTPKGAGEDLQSTLVRVECSPGGRPGVSATYRVTSEQAKLSFLVNQSYRFDPYDPNERCEATETLNCVRYWPTVIWALDSAVSATPPNNAALGIVQRFENDTAQFLAGGSGSISSSHGAADLIADVFNLSSFGAEDLGSDGRLKREDVIVAMKDGKTVHWDNLHQTHRASVGLPGASSPGCSECVHAHWSWFGDASIFVRQRANSHVCGSPHCWSDGTPELVDGSKQTACIGWVKTTTAVVDGKDWCLAATQAKGESVNSKTDRLVVFWQAQSSVTSETAKELAIDGVTYRAGDAAWPQLKDKADYKPQGARTRHGGNGSWFFVPARRIALLPAANKKSATPYVTFTPQWNKAIWQAGNAARGWPAGWALPVEIKLQNFWFSRLGLISDSGRDEKGPYYLRVRTSAGLLNAAPLYQNAFRGAGVPWVLVYDDAFVNNPAGSNPPWTLGANLPLEVYPGDRKSMTALVVFANKPSPQDTSFDLDAAPNGVGGYVPSIGR